VRLADVVATAVADQRAPAAALALVYAESIDEATHVPLGLAAALAQLERAAQLADESSDDERPDELHMRAYLKVAAALGAVTVASDLGPKLLASLDALLLTPKARAAAGQALGAATATGPLERLRGRHDGRQLRAVR
jgi:hypothetical protein